MLHRRRRKYQKKQDLAALKETWALFQQISATMEHGRHIEYLRRFTGLDASLRYSVEVGVKGFNPYTQNVQLSSNSQRLDMLLDLVTVVESVVVKASGTVISLESSAPEISQTITPDQVAALPSANRNVTKYALLNPHVRQSQGLASDGNNDRGRSSVLRHTPHRDSTRVEPAASQAASRLVTATAPRGRWARAPTEPARTASGARA